MSPAMQAVFRRIALAAPTDVSVLITGESGTGKELVARAIHRHSPRRDGPYLPVCIPALNASLIESELFGHVRGAFTGASDNRSGLLELAAGGTVLLDEIAEVPASLQVKLLRALEQREVIAVGDARARPIDVRVLAATNRPLGELIATGRFREDLYFRLAAFEIQLPPLRERREDIGDLARHFARSPGRGGWPPGSISPEAVALLERRDWPGNVRELRNAIEHGAVLARGEAIRPEHLPAPTDLPVAQASSTADQIRAAMARWVATASDAIDNPDDPQLYDRFLQLVEPPLLEAVLRRCGNSRAAAASLLGLHRATLRQKLKRHGIG
jgi:two-component system nitrogen regulation response regulator GlnG